MVGVMILDYHTDLSDNPKPAIANAIMGLAKINWVSVRRYLVMYADQV